MCGLVGFFVGCNLAISCPKRFACNKDRIYKSSFKHWDRKASVRSAPERVAEANNLIFPEHYVPVLGHERLSCLDQKERMTLQQAALYRFLNFTQKLEMLVVNTVTANIAIGRYNAGFSDDVRLDAHRIYVDEAYHALFSFEMMCKAKSNAIDLRLMLEDTPAFLRRLQKIGESHTVSDRALLELSAVIISEMLITSTLKNASRAKDMDNGVSSMLDDHAQDEARHHAFYKHILMELWSSLSDEKKNIVISHLGVLLSAYITPDVRAITMELTYVGVKKQDAIEIVLDTYNSATVGEYGRDCSAGLISVFRGLEEPVSDVMVNPQGHLYSDIFIEREINAICR